LIESSLVQIYKLDDGTKAPYMKNFIQQSDYVVIPRIRDEENLYMRVKPNPKLSKATAKVYYLQGPTTAKQ
jgi:hypothetical protein